MESIDLERSKIPLRHRIPLTRIKLAAVALARGLLAPFLPADRKLISRGGIRYDADLSEAIDFSIFLAGHFQGYVTSSRYYTLAPDAVVVDVGANLGRMSLQLAQRVPEGLVYAIEPTNYGFERLTRNLALNPELASRIVPIQAFLSDRSAAEHCLRAYASWKIRGDRSGAHPLHGGQLEAAPGVPACSLDDLCEELSLTRLDLVKIDTEGHELSVLRGARKCLERFAPLLIFELGLYTLEEQGVALDDYFECLEPHGYEWLDLKTGRPIRREQAERQLPHRSTTDVLAFARRPQP